MKALKVVLAVLMGICLIIAGVNHFINPVFYNAMIPDVFPKLAVNYFIGAIEALLGIGLLIPSYRQVAGRGVLVLMILFLPIHVWDVFKDEPATGTHTNALIRLPIQFVLMAWAWFVSKP